MPLKELAVTLMRSATWRNLYAAQWVTLVCKNETAGRLASWSLLENNNRRVSR